MCDLIPAVQSLQLPQYSIQSRNSAAAFSFIGYHLHIQQFAPRVHRGLMICFACKLHLFAVFWIVKPVVNDAATLNFITCLSICIFSLY